MKTFYVGDKVSTRFGNGEVEGYSTWRDKIDMMDDLEATEFSSKCKRECGIDFKDRWAEVLVSIVCSDGKKRIHTLSGEEVEVINGREEERDMFATKVGIK